MDQNIGHKKVNVAMVLGSESDYLQCVLGFRRMEMLRLEGKVKVVGVYTASIHRNMLKVFILLLWWHLWRNVGVVITGAGWAAHLPGMCDAILRYVFRNKWIRVIGVGFEDLEDETHTLAAKLSISEVPSKSLIYRDEQGNFIGSDGWRRACEFAAAGIFPPIKLPSFRPWIKRSWPAALSFVRNLEEKKAA